jgi:hypothetical protein
MLYELKDGLLYKLLMLHTNCNTKKKLIYLPSSYDSRSSSNVS